jgi:hypothetical protein
MGEPLERKVGVAPARRSEKGKIYWSYDIGDTTIYYPQQFGNGPIRSSIKASHALEYKDRYAEQDAPVAKKPYLQPLANIIHYAAGILRKIVKR